MLRSLLKIGIFIILSFISFGDLFAASTSIENIFGDIKKDYEYYNELQTLYNKGMIYPESNGNFNPGKFISKDEFIGIISETSCINCIAPDTSYDLVNRYSGKAIYADINEGNKYFYCISDAENRGLLTQMNSTGNCDNGTYSGSLKSFCPNNNILLEEAMEIALVYSGLMTMKEASDIRQQIATGEIKTSLADDVNTIDENTALVNYYYPYFKKALEYELVEYDKYGNGKIYSFVTKIDNKLNPKEILTKEAALKIAFTAMKASSCISKDESSLGLQINIFPSNCNPEIVNSCRQSTLSGSPSTYDFYAKVSAPLYDSVSTEEQYTWRVYDYNSGTEKSLTGKYINDYNFSESGKYRIYLRVISDRGRFAEVYNELNIGENISEKSVSIFANKLFGENTLQVIFEGIVSGGTDKKSYFWSFGDGGTGYGKSVEHFYKGPGTYKVVLSIFDEHNTSDTASLYVNVVSSSNSDDTNNYYVGPPAPGDRDGDGVKDEVDWCPEIAGPASNNGCPPSYTGTPTTLDRDGDGIRNENDLCPDVVGPALNNGCPISNGNITEGDRDGDGIRNEDDWCPDVAGPASNNGCPISNLNVTEGDRDGDGVKDEVDLCPNVPGPASNNGCPTSTGNISSGDRDGDGIRNENDLCPDMAGPVSNNGCPIGYDYYADYDGDGVRDVEDLCPTVPGPASNKGCPVLTQACSSDADCGSNGYCLYGFCTPKQNIINCNYTGGDLIIGNLACNSCPCDYSIDFASTIRKCDVLFPAILSPNGAEIYSKGEYFQVQ